MNKKKMMKMMLMLFYSFLTFFVPGHFVPRFQKYFSEEVAMTIGFAVSMVLYKLFGKKWIAGY